MVRRSASSKYAFKLLAAIGTIVAGLWCATGAIAQSVVNADGAGKTYEAFSSQWGAKPYEVPDCSHPTFGRHITDAFDTSLNKYVFIFHLHLKRDDDRCISGDRQRTEVKAGYPGAPASIKGFAGDTMTWRWRFKLDSGFQVSSTWSVIHSRKAGDGAGASGDPIMQFDAIDQGAGAQIVLQYVDRSDRWQTLSATPLAPFRGVWVEAYEKASFPVGAYSITFRRVSDGLILWSYTNPKLDMWRDDSTFVYSKWGLYRGLGANALSVLRDEQVRYSDFCVAKAPAACR